MKFKRMGVLPGVADFLMFLKQRRVALELKNANGKQSEDQEKFERMWSNGGDYYICKTLEEFKSIVSAYVIF